MVLTITQCKPNPLGRDRYAKDIPNSQLAGEWLDFKNFGTTSVNLSEIVLYHTAYMQNKPNGVWNLMCEFDFTLPAGKSLRVHSGGVVPLYELKPIDRVGCDFHVFTGKGYTLNNDKPEEIGLLEKKLDKWVDIAKYNAYPKEGRILIRSGDYLI